MGNYGGRKLNYDVRKLIDDVRNPNFELLVALVKRGIGPGEEGEIVCEECGGCYQPGIGYPV
jgi:hypothetical protein